MYNLDILRKTLGNNEDTLKNLLKVFFRTVPQQVQNLTQLYENQNIEEIIFMAHKLKTSFLTVGMVELAELIKQIQENCKNNDFSNMRILLQNLNEKTTQELNLLAKEM
ncbi:MAG: Hpt domain-containing protein [Bacteroidetes bacterium]|nr:MAG: Hpt domain-containing protein [Bacteroidota bacterium]TAG85807.1 MAG: Hpt domain-containing protein [Bacteroidota bacterium]